MGKLIICLLLFGTLVISSAAQSNFVTCTNGQTCKPQFECPDVLQLTSKGHLTPEEKQYLRGKHCNKIKILNYFCCDDKAPQATTAAPSTKPSPAPRLIKPTNTLPLTAQLLPEPPKCGTYLADRVVGGQNTNIDDYPWVAQILYSRPGRSVGSHCGGSLISERWVITAAHCDVLIKQERNYDIVGVRLGDWDTRTNPDYQDFLDGKRVYNDPYVDIPVVQIISHEDYNPNSRNQYNDIALLKLKRDVKFTEWISPICLPLTSELRKADYTGHSLDVAGFGKTSTEDFSPVMQRLDIDGIERSRCQQYYIRQGVSLANTQLCAGGKKDEDSCNGDSGGPLMKYGNFPNSLAAYYMLVGIVSFGPTHCGTQDAPGVYTRVTEYMDWIESKIKNS